VIQLIATPDVLSRPIDGGPPRVLLLASAISYDRLAGLLRAGGASVMASLDAAAHEAPDLIVIESGETHASAHAGALDHDARPGVIALGSPDATDADVVLPADFSPRELQLACRLLTQVVRLRRKLREGTQEGQAWRQEASRDPLTQLPNRRAWDVELARRVMAARGTDQPLCVALVDLDHFKQVNDGWGHPAGDQLLVATAAALRQSLRQEDFVARLGGDEFGLLLGGLDAAAAAGVIDRVRAELPARIARVTPFVTSASIGYYVCQGDDDASPDQLLAHADRARRLAKTQGRDRTASV
jgi:diguanylate cyclase (GGDEF)-like protein